MDRERDRALVRYGTTAELSDTECDRVIDLVDRSFGRPKPVADKTNTDAKPPK